MSNLPIILAAAGAANVLIAWATYIATIPRGTVPVTPVGTFILQLGGMGLAAAGVAVAIGEDSLGATVIAPAAFAGFMGLFFVWLFAQRKTPVGDLKVAVGDSLLAFSSTDANGEPFHTGSLAGDRVLLKFFRGSW